MKINKLYLTAPGATPAIGAIPNNKPPISPMDIRNASITWTTPLVITGISKNNVEVMILKHNNLKSS